MEPIKPVLLAYTAKIKSVCGSGKYIGVLLKPYPMNPPEPIDAIPCSNWNPDELDQSRRRSILRKKLVPKFLQIAQN